VTKKYSALIKPWNKRVEVAQGETVLEVLTAQHIYIDSECGGAGTCGKCQIQIEGEYETDSAGSEPDKEIEKGNCLACQTRILGNVEITVPDDSRIGEPQILTKCEFVKLENLAPMVDKYWLELPAPTLTDNISDLERLQRALKSHVGDQSVGIDLDIVRKLGRTLRESNWSVTVTLVEHECGFEITNVEPGNTTSRKFGLAIDIGTTTVAVSLVNLHEGRLMDAASDYNKQMAYGADVISRIDYAQEEEDGLKRLNSLVIQTINSLIAELMSNKNNDDIGNDEIGLVVVAGNTTMMHLLLSVPPGSIKREPYIPIVNLLQPIRARDLGIEAWNAYLYCIPGRSAYVGGDITADILISDMHKEDGLSLLIDVGTNGEIVLGNREWLVGCSCSAGPAFEGGEVECGSRAVRGAIEKVHVTPDFNVEYSVIGNAKPIGICGSGLIDLLGDLFRCGIIDKNGSMKDLDNGRTRGGKEGKEFVVAFAEETDMGKDIVITEADLKNIIRTKAAIYAAASLLLKTVGYKTEDLAQIFIAGAFGNYLDARKSIMTGILPDVEIEKLKFIGNGALAGAQLVLLSKEKRKEAEDIFRKITYIDLSTNPKFFEEFTSALFLPHTDLELFPSVKKLRCG
jgi:uncharacterized 2Fe-2S/4Fe-4S cluster protein (DUF4445 family)